MSRFHFFAEEGHAVIAPACLRPSKSRAEKFEYHHSLASRGLWLYLRDWIKKNSNDKARLPRQFHVHGEGGLSIFRPGARLPAQLQRYGVAGTPIASWAMEEMPWSLQSRSIPAQGNQFRLKRQENWKKLFNMVVVICWEFASGT